MLLSMFCGAGGLDLGFEQAGFDIGLALDKKTDSVASYNYNRPGTCVGKEFDLSAVTCSDIDRLFEGKFNPKGVIGGPPCQSFSRANVNQREDDNRSELPSVYVNLVCELHARSPLDFVVMENVVGLTTQKHVARLKSLEAKLEQAGFNVRRIILNAVDHGVPQRRPRLFLIGVDRGRFPENALDAFPLQRRNFITVNEAIGNLPDPTFFTRSVQKNSFHPNHWCMTPKSNKFTREGGVKPGVAGRSFKMLSWHEPSITVSYGHREVHVHPNGTRRLSVYEAMLLQGFPKSYELLGTLSSQIDQVSEAVPPPLAYSVADAIKTLLY